VTAPDQVVGTGPEADRTRANGATPAASWGIRALFYGSIALIVLLMQLNLSRETIGALGLTLTLVLLLMKVPVAIAMVCGSALGIWALGGTTVLAGTFHTMPFHSVAGWSLSVVPMFIFMGLMLWRSGASERLYDASRHWIGWLPGGLAVGTNAAGAGLATVSGSTIGVTYALGRIGVPEMLRAGYDRRFATAAILMAGTGGQLIPPSILLVIYAGIASVPVGPQLLAGVLPGLLLAVAYGVLLVSLATVFPQLVGKQRRSAPGSSPAIRSSWHQRWTSLGHIWPVPLLAIGLLPGLYTGVFTATEAGAFGAAGSVLVASRYQNRGELAGAVRSAIIDTVRTTGAIFLLIIGAMVLSRFVTLSGVASWTVTAVNDLGLNRYEFLFALTVMFLALGMFMDSLAMMLITVPILMPVLAAYDISLIWFGVFLVLLGELAIITPPVGVLTFVLHKLVQDPEVNLGQRITLPDVFAGVLWFIPASIAVVVLLIFFPELVEIIPGAARS
jgi:C4-dicarboxylate transporter, DctM subunit